MLSSQPPPQPHRPQPAPARAPRRLARVSRAPLAHRWLGPFYCATIDCGTILGEIFADAEGTYLANIGGRPVRLVGIQCHVCGQVRQFHSRPAGNPQPHSPAPIAPLDESE